MITNRAAKVSVGLIVSGAVALVSLYVGQLVPLADGSFVSSGFITHTVMLALSLGIMLPISRGRFADFGFKMGTYRFRPTILLWVLPTAVLSLLSTLAPGVSEASDALDGRAVLHRVIFVWIYASVCEEVLARGLLQTLISGFRGTRTTKPRLSMPVVVSGLFFGAMHLVLIDSMGPAAVVPIVLATLLGFLAAHYREVTGSLMPAIIVHTLFNVGGMLPGWIIRWLVG